MIIDIDKIVDNDYIDSLLLGINNKIEEMKIKIRNIYSFDDIVNMSDDELDNLFNSYGINVMNIKKYRDPMFSRLFRYSDILPSSNQKFLRRYEILRDKAYLNVEELNKKINSDNASINEDIAKLMDMFNFIKSISSILKLDIVANEEEINQLKELIINSKLTDSDKFNLSYIISKFLISKNITLLDNLSIVGNAEKEDIEGFENALTDVYDNAVFRIEETKEEIIDEIKESKYIDTILNYYEKYEMILKNSGLGDNLEDILFTAYDISGDNLLIDDNSISKDDYAIQIANLLYKLKTMDYDEDVILVTLKELDDLDKKYNEYLKYDGKIKDLLEHMKSTVGLIKSKSFNIINNEVIEKLDELMLELRNNILTDKRIDEIEEQYKFLCNQLLVQQDSEDMLSNLFDLAEKVKKKITIASATHQKDGNSLKYFEQLVKLQEAIDMLIEVVKKSGCNKELLKSIDDLTVEINNLDIVPKPGDEMGEFEKNIILKGFVLFDFDENNVPYVVYDLDPSYKKCLIDHAIEPGKLIAGYKDYDKLINDLLLIGNAEKLANNDSHGNNNNRLNEPVYWDLSERSQKNSTGMWRIRPSLSSVCRFVEQRVILHSNTEIYNQVIGIIKGVLPKVKFHNEDLILYINFASSMKRVDYDTYEEAIDRYKKKSPLYKLFMTDDKESLTDKECELLKEIVKMSLNAYYDLSKKNQMLEFEVVEKIGGLKKYGL